MSVMLPLIMCHCVLVTAEEVSKMLWDFIGLGNETDQQAHVMPGSDHFFSSKSDLVCLPPHLSHPSQGKRISYVSTTCPG